LNGIIGMTAIAWGNISNHERMRDCLRKIEASSKLLQGLINNVLDMSRIESGKFVLNASPLYLPEFIGDLVSIVDEPAKAKSQKLNVLAEGFAHSYITADSLRLMQLLSNILVNAVKFTPEGGTISLTVTELPCDREDYALFTFVCRDTGVGMGEEFMRHLFESFSREQDSRIDKTEGSGLGLAIAKRITDMMDGEIKVESEKNKGTQITVTLAFPICEAKGALEENRDAAEYIAPRLKGVRVLMAEDNALNTEIAVETLTSAGLLLDCAENGKEAVDTFNGSLPGTYAMILMDMQMPVMTGCEAAAAIRKLPRPDAAAVPIIAMTANAFEEDIREALAAGMNAHVAKPVDFEALKEVMGKFLPTEAPPLAAAVPAQPAQAEPGSLLEALAALGVNVFAGLGRIGGNRGVYESILKKFPEDKSFETISAAMLSQDFTAAAKAAHALKGIAVNLSMEPFAQTVSQLEQALKREEYAAALELLNKAARQHEALIKTIEEF
jgi:CheY-like chemotaxis protein/anti-sigma regulatory factor (Ser/Thr protein kinase)